MVDLTKGIEDSPVFGPLDANSFEYVKTNIPGPGCCTDLLLEEFQGCSCTEACSGEFCPCINIFGPAYDRGLLLENRFSSNQPVRSIMECGKNCACDMDLCVLRLVQKGIHVRTKLQVIIVAEKGYGLVAKNKIARMSFVCEYAGEVIDEIEARRRLQETADLRTMNYLIAIKEYSSFSQSHYFVDPRLKGNIGRFINHSCDPNLIMIPVRVNHSIPRLALFSRRMISEGEELTFDYSGKTSLDGDFHLRPSVECQSVPESQAISGQSIPSSIDLKHDHDSDHTINQSPSPSLFSLAARQINSIECTDLHHRIKRRKIDRDIATSSAKDTEKNIQGMSRNDVEKTYENLSETCEINSEDSESGQNWIISQERTTGKQAVRDTLKENNLYIRHNSVEAQRKKCFCKSSNCRGFLPYDEQLFEK